MPKRQNHSATPDPAATLSDLSPEQAYSVGSTVGDLLTKGLPVGDGGGATATVAEFIRRGQQAQAAVDAILADHECRRTRMPKGRA